MVSGLSQIVNLTCIKEKTNHQILGVSTDLNPEWVPILFLIGRIYFIFTYWYHLNTKLTFGLQKKKKRKILHDLLPVPLSKEMEDLSKPLIKEGQHVFFPTTKMNGYRTPDSTTRYVPDTSFVFPSSKNSLLLLYVPSSLYFPGSLLSLTRSLSLSTFLCLFLVKEYNFPLVISMWPSPLIFN